MRVHQHIEEWDNQKVHRYILLDKGKVLGSVYLEIGEDYKTLHSLYVLPQYRLQGCAELLMTTLLLNYPGEKLFLKVNLKNKHLFKFYRKFGFRNMNKFKDETYVWMQLKNKNKTN